MISLEAVTFGGGLYFLDDQAVICFSQLWKSSSAFCKHFREAHICQKPSTTFNRVMMFVMMSFFVGKSWLEVNISQQGVSELSQSLTPLGVRGKQ